MLALQRSDGAETYDGASEVRLFPCIDLRMPTSSKNALGSGADQGRWRFRNRPPRAITTPAEPFKLQSNDGSCINICWASTERPSKPQSQAFVRMILNFSAL